MTVRRAAERAVLDALDAMSSVSWAAWQAQEGVPVGILYGWQPAIRDKRPGDAYSLAAIDRAARRLAGRGDLAVRASRPGPRRYARLDDGASS